MQEREIIINTAPQRRHYTPEQREALLLARKKRRAARRRNQIIFLVMCAIVLVLVLVGLVKGIGLAVSALRAVEWSSLSASSTVSTQSNAVDEDEDVVVEGTTASDFDISTYTYDPEDARLLLVNANLPLAASVTVTTEVADDITGVALETQAATSYRAMASAASVQGVMLTLCTGYLDEAGQQALLEEWQAFYVAEGYTQTEAESLAQSVVGEVGASEYQTGYGAVILADDYTSLDVGFADTAAFAWLETYAAEYGFILRYAEDKQMITGKTYQPWHWRYVGVENAKAIVASGLSLEEFIEADGTF